MVEMFDHSLPTFRRLASLGSSLNRAKWDVFMATGAVLAVQASQGKAYQPLKI
jgi:hypothetical protein